MAYVQVPWEADRIVLLQGIEQTDFFRKVRSDLVVSLYNQEELWPKFGYEGSSAEHGGYIKRRFNDIDWLPKISRLPTNPGGGTAMRHFHFTTNAHPIFIVPLPPAAPSPTNLP